MANAVDNGAISNSNTNDITLEKIDLSECMFPLKKKKISSRYKELYKFRDVQNMHNLPKFSVEDDYWNQLFIKKGAFKYTNEYISAYIKRKIEKISDYFNRLQTNGLREEEIYKKKPQNFLGPYFPSPKEIEILKSLNIYIVWEVPKVQQLLCFTLIKKGSTFSYMEESYLVKRWKKFQKEYKIYDLRPLLGVRTGTFDEDSGFTFFRMVDAETRVKFLQFMGKGLPEKPLVFIERRLTILCDQFLEGKFSMERRNNQPRGKEFCCIVELYKRYGSASPQVMELVIGKRNTITYQCNIANFLAFMHIPIRCSAWQKEEDLMLIKNLYENKKKIDIFDNIKSRTIRMICHREKYLKKSLASLETNLPIDVQKKKCWNNDDNVKLVTEIYNSNAESFRDIDWVKIAEKFPGFCNYSLREKFQFLYKTRIPTEKQKYFDEALEFLYHNVTPIYQIKHTRHRRLRTNLDYAMELTKSSKEARALNLYFNTIDLCDQEEEYKIMQSCSTYAGGLSAKKNITMDEDEIVLLSATSGAVNLKYGAEKFKSKIKYNCQTPYGGVLDDRKDTITLYDDDDKIVLKRKKTMKK